MNHTSDLYMMPLTWPEPASHWENTNPLLSTQPENHFLSPFSTFGASETSIYNTFLKRESGFEGAGMRSNGLGLNLGQRTYFSSSDGGVIVRRNSRGLFGGPVVPRCQAEGCGNDLTNAKHYHRRHKVCEFHSKATRVIANGLEQRFCQQCSRFHVLAEFDEVKRSCRRRLADHNRRRRKNGSDKLGDATKNSIVSKAIVGSVSKLETESPQKATASAPLSLSQESATFAEEAHHLFQFQSILLPNKNSNLKTTRLPYASSSPIQNLLFNESTGFRADNGLLSHHSLTTQQEDDQKGEVQGLANLGHSIFKVQL